MKILLGKPATATHATESVTLDLGPAMMTLDAEGTLVEVPNTHYASLIDDLTTETAGARLV